MFIHLKRGGKETKPLFICNNELTSDCSKLVGNINSPLIGWTANTAKMICVWKGKNDNFEGFFKGNLEANLGTYDPF